MDEHPGSRRVGTAQVDDLLMTLPNEYKAVPSPSFSRAARDRHCLRERRFRSQVVYVWRADLAADRHAQERLDNELGISLELPQERAELGFDGFDWHTRDTHVTVEGV
jgi:hypothetical protein